MSMVIPVAGGSSFAAVVEVFAPTEEGQENLAPEDAYLELADPDKGTTVSDVLPAKKLRIDHPTLVSGTDGKRSSSTLGVPVDTTTAARTSIRAIVTTKFATDVNPDLAGPSQPEELEGSDDSFYEHPTLDPSKAKRCGPRCSLAFFSALLTLDYDQLYTEFNVGAARQVCLGAKVRSRTEHELELKEKLRAKYTARGRLLEEKDLEIHKLKSQLKEKEVEAVEVIRLRDQVSSLPREKSTLTAKDFKERMETQHEEQAQELYNRMAELEAHALCVTLWVDAYNPKVARASYINAVKALEDVDFPLVNLLKSKKDVGIDEVLDCFLLDRPLAGFLKAAYLQPCIEQLSIPIHHAGDKMAVGETSLSIALMNVHARAEGAKKHAAALLQLMMEIVSAPLSS
ncbi:hypothetical protein Tco_0773374 [Tanacetum coccineum]|uniref:Uncharacterized protein n=1 Tax=Tanacetum coccineum TaxID=301880 RepID=A0ABQ4ZPH9_9ASTR